ncbi:MAG: hypothetical protein V8R80_01395 [Eubacterium sp.]
MELKMDISQKQILSQHMVQSMEILQMSAQELESYIENLALENPVIELPDSHSSSRIPGRRICRENWTGWNLPIYRIKFIINRSDQQKICRTTGMTAGNQKKI